MLIAFPLSYYLLNEMLNDYAYRINISWWMFAVALLLTLILTLLTVSFQAIKAATNNPVNAIKSD
jgi:putative ABC transport system permease protein